ncbi:hypothetical protein C8J56DRAFT_1040729 [Mycena floridula]|nr:hypothetical protein C8J56DRAFT_1040729 [Mycena floridula]
MHHTKKANQAGAALARAARENQHAASKAAVTPVVILDDEPADILVPNPEATSRNSPDTELESDDEIQCTAWTGGVLNIEEDSDDKWKDEATDLEGDDNENDIQELEGAALVESIQVQCELELELEQLNKPNAFDALSIKRTSKDWKKAGQNWGLGYNGQSDSWKQEKAWNKAKEEKASAALWASAQSVRFTSFFNNKGTAVVSEPSGADCSGDDLPDEPEAVEDAGFVFHDYLSDKPDDEDDDEPEEDGQR